MLVTPPSDRTFLRTGVHKEISQWITCCRSHVVDHMLWITVPWFVTGVYQ